MTTQDNILSEDQNKTTVGNYFVANYPPFSFWSSEQINKVDIALDKSPQPETPLGIYVHIPFCRKRCHFCYFRVYTGHDAKPDRVSKYVDVVLRELELYAARPLVAGRKPLYIYFGGGTPSFLSPESLNHLVGRMKELLSWDDAQEVTFECEPGTLNEDKLDALRALGVTRLSLGVEHFDDEILKTNGRAHLSEETYLAYQYARSIEFRQINIDLIAGMLNETDTKWKTTVQKAVELEPDCVTVYQMEIPFNTTIYQGMRERGEIVAPVADWPTKRDWVHYAFEQLEKAGYTVNSTTTAVKDPKMYRFLYRDYLWTGADMVSLGVASFGHFRGTHYQNEKDFGPYMASLERGQLPIRRALAMTDEEKLIREVILQLKLGRLERAYFQRKFNIDIFQHCGQTLGKLRDEGLVTMDDDRVQLSRHGLIMVDQLLHRFFLPQHQHVRYS